jgi:uncharacterized protein (TIGR03086 family)
VVGSVVGEACCRRRRRTVEAQNFFRGSAVDVRDVYRRASDSFGARVRSVSDDQWGLPTPCPDWDVAALVEHLVEENMWVPLLLSGLTVEAAGKRIPDDVLGDYPIRAWESSSAEAVAAVNLDRTLDRTVHLSFGDVPGREYVMQLLADLVVHSWDLATATGGDQELDVSLLEPVADWFDSAEDLYREAGVIGPRTPTGEDASTQDRLLAAFGRDPFSPG